MMRRDLSHPILFTLIVLRVFPSSDFSSLFLPSILSQTVMILRSLRFLGLQRQHGNEEHLAVYDQKLGEHLLEDQPRSYRRHETHRIQVIENIYTTRSSTREFDTRVHLPR